LPTHQIYLETIIGPTPPPRIELRNGVLHIDPIRARCEQRLQAFWRPDIVGTWKTSGTVLIQPVEMFPQGVAKCDGLYRLAIRLPQDAAFDLPAIFERDDFYTGEQPWRRIVAGVDPKIPRKAAQPTVLEARAVTEGVMVRVDQPVPLNMHVARGEAIWQVVGAERDWLMLRPLARAAGVRLTPGIRLVEVVY